MSTHWARENEIHVNRSDGRAIDRAAAAAASGRCGSNEEPAAH